MLSDVFFSLFLFITHSGGGISSYAGQQKAAGQSLKACLDQAVKDIPKDKHQLTPVYLGATAGMRLLKWVSVCERPDVGSINFHSVYSM